MDASDAEGEEVEDLSMSKHKSSDRSERSGRSEMREMSESPRRDSEPRISVKQPGVIMAPMNYSSSQLADKIVDFRLDSLNKPELASTTQADT